MKTYLRHKVQNVIDIKSLLAIEALDFEGKYRGYVEQHDFWELCYVQKGSVTLRRGTETVALCERDLTLIPPGETHSYASENGNETVALVICFECFSQPLKALSAMTFPLGEDPCMEMIIREYRQTFYMNEQDLLSALPTSAFGGQQAVLLQLEYLLICLIRRLSSEKNPEVVFLREERFYADLVDVILTFLRDNIGRKLTLEEICARVNYSRSFVCKVFKEQTGERLFTCFNRMKTEEAKRLLEQTDLPTDEIADRLGFRDTKYFGAMFKKNVGVAPSVYRRRMK